MAGVTCPQCGAVDCDDELMRLLALESLSQELQGLHYYNVAAYNVQHPAAFDPEAYAIMRDTFIAAVDGGWDGSAARREVKRRLAPFDGPRKVLRPEGERVAVPRAWTMTISDALVADDPVSTAAGVKRWAASVRMDLAQDS